MALLRTLHLILGWRPVLLVPLCLRYSATDCAGLLRLVGGGAEQSADAGCAGVVCGDAIQLERTGNRRYVVTSTLAYLCGLSFFEKSAVIPFVAFGMVVALNYVSERIGTADSVAPGVGALDDNAANDRGLDSALSDSGRPAALELGPTMTWDLLRRSVTHGIVPGLVEWRVWQRWAPACRGRCRRLRR